MPRLRHPEIKLDRLAILLLLWGFVATPLPAADYFVSNQGIDTNPGTIASPFLSLGRAVRDLKPGDTLFVRAGTYTGSSEFRYIPSGDSWERPVIIKGFLNERPIIIPEPKETVVYITGTKYVVLDGLVIDAKGGHDGIKITYFTGGEQAHHIRVQNCEIKNASNQGLLVAGEGNEFINLDVHDNGTTGFHHGIYLSAEGNLIDGGKYYRNAGWGIHVYPKATNTIVRNVRSFQNGATGLGLVWGSNNQAYNNLVSSNGSGIHLSGDSPHCYNNTVYANRGEGISVANADNGPSGTRNAEVRNNIVFLNEAGIKDYAIGAGTILSNNLEGDAHFVETGAGDFRLRMGSPAIDKGEDLRAKGVTTDIEGNPRPQGEAFDIGAHEFVPSRSDHQGAVGTSSGDRSGGGPVDLEGFPAVSQLISQPGLPDPLKMFDGRPVTTPEQWFTERRPELIALFQHYMYGFLPPPPGNTAGTIAREDRNAFGGRATIRELTVRFGEPQLRPIHLMVIFPNERNLAAPVILGMNYFGNHSLVRDPAVALSTNWMPERGEGVVNNRSTEASRGTWVDIWQIEKTISRGYAVATFYNGDLDPDTPDQRGIQTHYGTKDPKYNCGTIAAWAWGLQRAVDYLVTDPDVDPKRIVVTGHSRLGKAALLAAAFDERIALAIPHQAGCGGSAPSRSDIASARSTDPSLRKPETVRQINDKFPHWFNSTFKEFNDHPHRLPFDQHCLVALCAPRPVLFTNGRQDTWINPDGQYEVMRAAAPVYQLLQAGGFDAAEVPPDNHLLASALGFFLRPGGHSLSPEDWAAFLDFADTRLGPPDQPLTKPAPTRGDEAARKQSSNSEKIPRVPRWEFHEFVLQGRSNLSNPFDAVVAGEFTAPSGKNYRVDAFYDGDNTWRLRYAPNEEGEWHYRLESKTTGVFEEGRLLCTAPISKGFVRVHPENPYAFAYSDGTPFFPMGDTCYGLFDDSPITPALRKEYLETRRRQRFNFVRMTVGHSELRAANDLEFWAWGGTPGNPDLDRLNPVFFRGLDELFRELRNHGMNVELLLLNFYRRPFADSKMWTAARERLWLHYIIARYAAFNNVFLWTVANEYETHPDGQYRLDLPTDVEWAKATARLVKGLDPYKHLVTVHPVVSATTRGANPRVPFEHPWRIGEFFGEGDAMDVLSHQTGQAGEGITWNNQLQCWVGDDPNLVRSIRADRRFRKPVLNTENGYEYLRGHPTEKKQVHHTDKVRRSSWRIVCAGGYFAAGFNGTIGHSDVWNRIDAPNHYTFTVADEGAATQLAYLYDCFTALPFWRLEPFMNVSGNAVAMAEPGKLYVVYAPHGGTISLDLTAVAGSLNARWFNPRTGQFLDVFAVSGGGEGSFDAPDSEDWTLLLRQN